MCNLPRRWCLLPAIVSAFALTVSPASAAKPRAEIVVAIRYLQQTGVSHSHLCLYGEGGELLRQLTKDDTGQDHRPVFAPDGETIVFTREISDSAKQWWSVKPTGGALHQLPSEPDWYAQAKDSPSFAESSTEGKPDAPNAPVFPMDSTVELALTPTEKAGSDPIAEWYVTLRNPATRKEIRLAGTVAGWFPALLLGEADAPFLQEGGWKVAFIATHLGSSDGAIVQAVNLDGSGFVQVARHWATPVALPGEAAFLSDATERYVPFGDGTHTANCSYVDRWDSRLKRTRYAREGAAAINYGASMYRPGKTPAVIIVRGEQS